jgi:hypothetical protein
MHSTFTPAIPTGFENRKKQASFYPVLIVVTGKVQVVLIVKPLGIQ